MRLVTGVLFSVLLSSAAGLDNGLALTPPMGLSTWNLASSDVSIDDVKKQVTALISTGLASLGYGSMHVDEGWLLGRNATTGEIISDSTKFPGGMKAAGDWVHAQTFSPSPAALRRARAVEAFHGLPKGSVDAASSFTYWLYTSRGTVQCGTSSYHAVGSQGHEKQDAAWMAAAGADGLKIDSCGGVQNPPQAIADYALWRDSMNATGRPMVFSLCGWKPFYSPPGSTLGNLWRISGDGRSWGPLSVAMNHNAYLGMNAGPDGWNDPDLLQGDGSGCHGPDRWGWYQSNLQSRAQMSMWSITASPLIISASVADSNAFLLDTWGNEEVIDVNQDPMGVQGARIVGEDVQVFSETNLSGTNVWARPLHDGSWALALLNNNADEANVTCGPACLARLRFNTSALAPSALRAAAVSALQQTGSGTWGNAFGWPVSQPGQGYSNTPVDGLLPVFFTDCGALPKDQQQWRIDASAQRVVHEASGQCLTVGVCGGQEPVALGLQPCGAPTTCTSAQNWTASGASGPIRSATGMCMDQYDYNTSFADLYTCNGGQNQQFTLSASGQLQAQQSGQCLSSVLQPQDLTVRVRDLWAKKDLSPIHLAHDTISALLPGNGSVAMYRLWVDTSSQA